MISNHEQGRRAQVKEQSAPEIMLVLSIYLFLKRKTGEKIEDKRRDFCLRISEMSKAFNSMVTGEDKLLISHLFYSKPSASKVL